MSESRVGSLPHLTTERLLLRGLDLSDAPALQCICEDRDVAAGTRSIPHPYPEDGAVKFIRECAEKLERHELYLWGFFTRDTEALLGTIGLIMNKEHNNAEIGFIAAREHRGKGYASEACAEIVRYGFEDLSLHRVWGHCIDWNEPSARVMQNAGLEYEGLHRGEVRKWGVFEDTRYFGLTRPMYDDQRARDIAPGE